MLRIQCASTFSATASFGKPPQRTFSLVIIHRRDGCLSYLLYFVANDACFLCFFIITWHSYFEYFQFEIYIMNQSAIATLPFHLRSVWHPFIRFRWIVFWIFLSHTSSILLLIASRNSSTCARWAFQPCSGSVHPAYGCGSSFSSPCALFSGLLLVIGLLLTWESASYAPASGIAWHNVRCTVIVFADPLMETKCA